MTAPGQGEGATGDGFERGHWAGSREQLDQVGALTYGLLIDHPVSETDDGRAGHPAAITPALALAAQLSASVQQHPELELLASTDDPASLTSKHSARPYSTSVKTLIRRHS